MQRNRKRTVVSGEGEANELLTGYRVSVLQDEKVLELYYDVNILRTTELYA
jgi:hypothetical protein